jgi:hypothetical protein
MMPQPQNIETKTVAVEPAVSEKLVEEAQADSVESGASNERPAEVEEIHSDEAPMGKTQPKKRVAEKKEDPNPLLLDPYEFDQCTITIIYTHVGDQQASVSVHNHKDDPIVKTFPLAEVLLPEQVEGVMKKLLEIWPDGKVSATMVLLPGEGEAERKMVVSVRAGSDTPIVLSGRTSELPLPAPITAMLDELKELLPARAMKKMEKEAKEKSRTNPKTAAAKTTSPTPTKAAPVKIDGKTQMTLF